MAEALHTNAYNTPAPHPGQSWNIVDLIKKSEASLVKLPYKQYVKKREKYEAGMKRYAAGKVKKKPSQPAAPFLFKTLMGTYMGEVGVTPVLDNMSLHYWYLPEDFVDDQTPHKQDEAYYIVQGTGKISVGGFDQDVSNGSFVFVPRCVPHHFHSIKKPLAVLIFFSPDFTDGS